MTNLKNKSGKLESLFRKVQKTLPPEEIVKIIVRKEFFGQEENLENKKMDI